MAKNILKLDIENVTRVEGHGNVVLDVKEGKVKKIQWQVSEAPRCFEAFLRGRSYNEISLISSRICGICSKAHSLAALRAIESALDIRISEQTLLLRKLALHSEIMQSHILHLGYLVAPDLYGLGSDIPLKNTHPNDLAKIVAFHRMTNEMSVVLSGRAIHPIRFVLGGFTKMPAKKELTDMKEKLEKSVKTLQEISDLALSKVDKLPDFTRETEYISLSSEDEYAFYDGMISSTDTGKHKVEDYDSVVNEYVVPQSTAKYTKHNRDSYMVGALARFNNNSLRLSPMAVDIADKFGLKSPCYNPFMNNFAQLTEMFHCLENAINTVDKLLEMSPLEDEKVVVDVHAGRGIGCIEAPRGILFHEYMFDENGKCTKANFLIPTNQNHGNIQKDMEAFAPTLLDKSKSEIELNLEMLVRAYDPCISCSTHYLKVQFV